MSRASLSTRRRDSIGSDRIGSVGTRKSKEHRPLEISRFVALEFSCQTLFAFTFIMGVAQSNPLQAARPANYPPACGRTCTGQMPAPIRPPTRWVNSGTPTIMLDCAALRDPRDKWCVQHASVHTHASEQTLPVNISGMASTTIARAIAR